MSRLAEATTHWPQLLAIIVIFYLEVFISAWRWHLLLAAQGVPIGLSEGFSLTMIGSFFNVVIPGAVGGDVIKGYYLSRRLGKKNSGALTTILMDRVLGLFGLLLLISAGTIWTIHTFESDRSFGMLRWCAIAIFAAGSGALTLTVMAGFGILNDWVEIRWLAPFVKALHSMAAYQRSPQVLVMAICASVFNHMLSCLAFYLALQTVDRSAIPWGYVFPLVPLGLMTTVIPVSLAGVGVGQAAFYALFQIVPSRSGALAANAFTVFQFILIFVYLSGVYSYLTYRRAAGGELPAGVVS